MTIFTAFSPEKLFGIKVNYLTIPAIVSSIVAILAAIVRFNLDWYETIRISARTPSVSIIGAISVIIYILFTLSVLVIWNEVPRAKPRCPFCEMMGLVLFNGAMNFLWVVLFFWFHEPSLALYVSFLILGSLIVLMLYAWITVRTVSYLLVPQLLWTGIAVYFNYSITLLN